MLVLGRVIIYGILQNGQNLFGLTRDVYPRDIQPETFTKESWQMLQAEGGRGEAAEERGQAFRILSLSAKRDETPLFFVHDRRTRDL